MNFDPVNIDAKGRMHMKLDKPFNIVEKIQLLQRWILVQSFCYYELNENCASDFTYDANAMQLADLIKQYPDEFERSRYHLYFQDYCSGDDNIHYTSGFDLLDRVRKKDKELYRKLHMDAANALHLKQMRGAEYVQ